MELHTIMPNMFKPRLEGELDRIDLERLRRNKKNLTDSEDSNRIQQKKGQSFIRTLTAFEVPLGAPTPAQHRSLQSNRCFECG